MRQHFLLVITIFLAMPHLARGADANGVLHGVVHDPDGAVVAGAAILIQHWELKDGDLTHAVLRMEPALYTDAKGEFSVKLPPGVYDVFVSFAVFAPSVRELRIEAGKETAIKCDLRPSRFTKYIY